MPCFRATIGLLLVLVSAASAGAPGPEIGVEEIVFAWRQPGKGAPDGS